MAELTDKLFDRYGLALVGFDVVWAEPDPSSGNRRARCARARGAERDPEFQRAYARLRPRLDFDARFAESLKGRPVVLGYYFNSEERVRVNALPAPVLPRGTFAGANVFFPQWVGYTGNLPVYLRNAAGAGHINPAPTSTASPAACRCSPSSTASTTRRCRSPWRALLARGTGELPTVAPGFPKDRPQDLEWLDVGGIKVPVDETASALIPYRGRKFSSRYVSLADVLRAHRARDAKGQDRARRHHRAGTAGPALDAGRSRVPRRRDPRQPDRRHPGQRDQASALVYGGRRGLLLAGRGVHPRGAHSEAVGALGDGGDRGRHRAHGRFNVASWHGGMVLPSPPRCWSPQPSTP